MSFQAKTLSLSKGGTNANLTASNGGILYSTASAAAILSGTATAGQMLQSGASTTPAWSTATYPATAGTSGNVLKSDGTNIVSSSNSGNLVLIQSQTATNSSAINFTSGITGYNIYRLVFFGITSDQVNNTPQIQFSTDGGSTYSATGYDNQGFFEFTGVLLPFNNSSGTAGVSLTYQLQNSATAPCSGSYDIYYLGNSSFNKQSVGTSIADDGGTFVCSTIGTLWSTSTVVNALRIVMVSGNIKTGTFNLYGVQN